MIEFIVNPDPDGTYTLIFYLEPPQIFGGVSENQLDEVAEKMKVYGPLKQCLTHR